METLCPHFSYPLHCPPPLLNESSYGYEIYGQKVTHLFYMDDLKTYIRDDEHQTGFLKIVKTFSDAKATFKRGRLAETTNIELDADTCTRWHLQVPWCK